MKGRAAIRIFISVVFVFEILWIGLVTLNVSAHFGYYGFIYVGVTFLLYGVWLFIKLQQMKKGLALIAMDLLVLAFPVLVSPFIMFRDFVPAEDCSKLIECEARMRMMGNALDLYSSDFNGQFPKSLDALSPKYLQQKDRTECPVSRYPYCYEVSEDQENCTLTCRGNAHKGLVGGENFPRFTSFAGLETRESPK
ncbi:MAG: hypothetical protein AB2L14_00045 [Candidatus Xenobiia bacterium LiM19]